MTATQRSSSSSKVSQARRSWKKWSMSRELRCSGRSMVIRTVWSSPRSKWMGTSVGVLARAPQLLGDGAEVHDPGGLLLGAVLGARDDGRVDIGRLGPQRPHSALLARPDGERVEPEVAHGVEVGDLVDLVVGDPLHVLHERLGRLGPGRVGVRVVA